MNSPQGNPQPVDNGPVPKALNITGNLAPIGPKGQLMAVMTIQFGYTQFSIGLPDDVLPVLPDIVGQVCKGLADQMRTARTGLILPHQIPPPNGRMTP
jgi:hypothetical protein